MDLDLRGKRVFITGASRGIGRACARAFAAEGARIAICARGADDLTATLDTVGGRESAHDAFAVDLMAPDGPRKTISWLSLEHDPVDIVIHNLGGTLGIRDPVAPASAWRDVWRLNMEIAVELNEALLPPMIERRAGRMVFVSSLAAFEHHGSLSYGVAKAALTAYTRGLGRTCAPKGVVVSAIVPGVIMSEGGHWEQNLRNDPEYVERYIRERLPRGEFGTAEEVAQSVLFLSSQHAAPFTGSIVPLEGGQGRSFFGQ